MSEKKYVEQLPQESYWMPEEDGEILEGTVLEKRTGNYGVELLIVDAQANKHITPGHKVLQDRIYNVNIGDKVRLTFKGAKQGKKGEVYIYKVEKEE